MSGDGKIIAKKEIGDDLKDIDLGGDYLYGRTSSGGHFLLNDQLERISDEYEYLNSSSEFRGRYLLAKSKPSFPSINYIDERGKVLLPHNTVFYSIWSPKYYTNEYAVVGTDPKGEEGSAILKSDGTIVSFNEEWGVNTCYKNFAIVYKGDAIGENLNILHNLMDYDGNLLLDEWCDDICGNEDILILTTSTGKQVLTTDLKPFFVDDIRLSREDRIYFEYNNGGICVMHDGKCAYFDENGRWMFNKMWFDELVSLSTRHAVGNYVGDKLYKLCPNGKVKEIKDEI